MRNSLSSAVFGWMLSACIASGLVQAQPALTQPATVLPLDWTQLATRGLDATVSEDGQRWYVGTDGRAYRWVEAGRSWVVHGTRNDLARIDASRAGAAALTRSGELLVTSSDPKDQWRATGMRATDVGIANSQLWLADGALANGGRAVLVAAFDASGVMTWRDIAGRIERIDVDPQGRPWGLDKDGRLFVYADGGWIEDAQAPPGSDVGVGADGVIYVIGKALDAGAGGGALHLRNPLTGVWSALPGRLSAVSVDTDGRAFGVNSLSWVLSGARVPVTAAASPVQSPAPLQANEVRLADLAPAGLTLPDTLNEVVVKVRSGSLASANTVLTGDATLNGLATRVIRYAPAAGPASLLLLHRTLRVGDYLPDLQNTGAKDFPFSDVIVSFVPAANAEKKARATDATQIAKEPGLAGFADFAPPAGTTLTGTLDLAVIPNGTAVSGLLGLGTSKVVLTARNVDAALFQEVRDSQTAVSAVTPARTLKELTEKYGTKLIESLAFEAPIKALDGKTFGPGKLTGPIWQFSLAQSEQPAPSITLSMGLAATMGVSVRAPPGDSIAQTGGRSSSAPVQTTSEILELSNVRVLFNPLQRSATLDGNITRAAADKVAALKGFAINSAAFTGQLALADGQNSVTSLTSLKTLDLALATKGSLPSQASTSGAQVDLDMTLALNEERNALVPSVVASGALTLADIVGNGVVGADRIKLTRVEWTPGTLAGTVALYGLPVKAVRHQTAGMANPIVGLHHQELDLGSYIPAIRGTNLGSFGLANAVFYVLAESAQAVTYATRAAMPAPLAALLDRDIADEEIFPLALKPGVNVIGQYGTKGAQETDNGATARVKAVYGMEDKTYVAKGNFKVSALSNAKLESGRTGARTVSARSVACTALDVADKAKLGDTDGLDLSFGLPDFRPPYVGGNVRFSNTRFALKEVEGQLEPAIVTAMALKLAKAAGDINDLARSGGVNASVNTVSNTAGINELGLAAKLRVKGDLNTLCNGVKPDSSYEIAFAGATALNLAQVGNTAFASLERVTTLDAPEEKSEGASQVATPSDPLAARALAAARKVAEDMAKLTPPARGWKPAFGLPFLEIQKFAAAGTFGQTGGKRSITGTLWTSSVVGSEAMDVLGSMRFESDVSASEYQLADWLLRIPGPVRLAGLPGMERLAAAVPFAELGDFTVRRLDLTPKLMTGQLTSASRAITGSMVVIAEAEEGSTSGVQLFAAVNRLAPNMLLKPAAQLPDAVGSITLGQTLLALRSGTSTTAKVSDLPPAVGRLFTVAVGDLVTDDTTIALVRGISVAGRLNPAEIPDQPVLANLKGLFDTLEMRDPVPVFGGIEPGQGPGGMRRFMETAIANARVPGLPQGELRFGNTRLSFATLEGRALRAETDITFVPPASLASAIPGNELRMKGLINYTRTDAGDTSVTLSGMSNLQWNPSFGITGLAFGNLGIEVNATRRGAGSNLRRSKSVTLLSDATFRDLATRARLGLTSDASGRGGTLLELVARDDGQLLSLDAIVNALPLLPSTYRYLSVANYLSLKARGILIGREAGSGRVSMAAEDVEGSVNGQVFKGQLAIAGISGASPVLFIANDQPWTPARVFPAAIPKGPFADLPLPEGLVVLSPSKGDANASELHPRIYDKVFARLYGAREAARVLTNEGLTVVGKLNLSRNLPEPVKAALGPVTGWLPASGDMVAGGGIDSASGGLAFYVDVQGLSLPIPAPLNTFVRSTEGTVQVFFKTAGASGAGSEVGISTDVQFGLPRLDQPATVQTVTGRMSLAYTAAAGAAPALSVAVNVPGQWNNPAGLDGFTLTDSNVAVGVSAAGTTVSVATQRAQFRDKAFALDLNTAWAGGVPTQLSVQFAKSPDTTELIVTPALQAELANSVLQVALKGGSSLQAAIGARLNAQSAFTSAARDAFNGVATLIGNSANGAVGLMRNSPLSMIGVRNPVVYFATPGDDLPDRPGIERPPFGLGLLVKGDLILDVGSTKATMAGGEYKINLRDGFYVKGSITPPAPFASTTLSVSGSQPLISPTPNALNVSGKLELPGAKFLNVLDASMSGDFAFTKPVDMNSGADVSARVSIGSLASRAAYFTVQPDSVRIYSAPDGGCTDVPLKLNGTVSAGSLTNPASLLGIASLDAPDPVKCATQIGTAIVDTGKKVVKFFRNIGSSPPRASYDCTNLEDPAFGAEYPPGRIWIARDEYTRGASSGAYGRYIFSEAEQKFRPFGAKGALGGTACGGLIGVEGVGLGRFAGDDELWSKALTCNFIPPDMKGAAVNTASECYAARGLAQPRRELAGFMVVAQGDDSKTTSIITPEGVARRVGGGNDWAAYEQCQLNDFQYVVRTLPLDEMYKLAQGAPIRSGAECKTALGSYWKPYRHPRTGQLVVYGDTTKNVNLVMENGTKRWIGNKDNWNVFNACGLQEKNLTYVSSAENNAIPDGSPIGSADDCKNLWLALNPPGERQRLEAELNQVLADRAAAYFREIAAKALATAATVRQQRINNCQSWANTYFITAGRGFGWAPANVQSDWRNGGCDGYGIAQQGSLHARCEAFRNRWGFVDGGGWKATPPEAQKTYNGIGCRKGV